MSTAHGPHISLRTYIVVFVLLMALLGVTVVAATLNLGAVALLIAMLIASAKSALVVLYFMHVRYASGLTKVFVMAAFIWLGILFTLTFGDYLTRGDMPMSEGWTKQTAIPMLTESTGNADVEEH